MPAKLTLQPPERAPRYLVIRDGETLLIGRDPICDLVIDDPRVSKRHARLAWDGRGDWILEDLGSTNGTRVNQQGAAAVPLASGDYLSFGGLPGRFERIDAATAAAIGGERLARLQTSTRMRRRLRAHLEPVDLLQRFLESAIDVTTAERGFVLVAGDDGVLRAETAVGSSPEEFEGACLAWSAAAVARALETRKTVAITDARRDPLLASSANLPGLLRGLVCCVPMFQEQRLLGLIYLDSREPGAALEKLDLEILEALAAHTAVVIGSARVDRRLRCLQRPLASHDNLLLPGQTVAQAELMPGGSVA